MSSHRRCSAPSVTGADSGRNQPYCRKPDCLSPARLESSRCSRIPAGAGSIDVVSNREPDEASMVMFRFCRSARWSTKISSFALICVKIKFVAYARLREGTHYMATFRQPVSCLFSWVRSPTNFPFRFLWALLPFSLLLQAAPARDQSADSSADAPKSKRWGRVGYTADGVSRGAHFCPAMRRLPWQKSSGKLHLATAGSRRPVLLRRRSTTAHAWHHPHSRTRLSDQVWRSRWEAAACRGLHRRSATRMSLT